MRRHARAIFFIMTRQPKLTETVSAIVHNFHHEMTGRRTIDCTAFKWDQKCNGEQNSKLKVVNMPLPDESKTPSRSSSRSSGSFFSPFKRARTMERSVEIPISIPDYSWLAHIRLPFSATPPSLSPTTDAWMIESATLFSQSLTKTADMIIGRGSSVWFMVAPLQTVKLGPSAAVISFSHWGILISKSTRWDLQVRIANPTDPTEELGDIHELRNHNGITQYNPRPYYMKDFQSATKLDYLGQTALDMNDILDFGISY
jgi:hypothetical protein